MTRRRRVANTAPVDVSVSVIARRAWSRGAKDHARRDHRPPVAEDLMVRGCRCERALAGAPVHSTLLRAGDDDEVSVCLAVTPWSLATAPCLLNETPPSRRCSAEARAIASPRCRRTAPAYRGADPPVHHGRRRMASSGGGERETTQRAVPTSCTIQTLATARSSRRFADAHPARGLRTWGQRQPCGCAWCSAVAGVVTVRFGRPWGLWPWSSPAADHGSYRHGAPGIVFVRVVARPDHLAVVARRQRARSRGHRHGGWPQPCHPTRQ